MQKNTIKITALFLFLTLLWTGVTLAAYTHIHVDQQGRITAHAHPFHRHGNTSGPGHHHSGSEIAAWATFYKLLSFLLAGLIIVFFALLQIRNTFSFQSQTKRVITPLASVSRRGPPASLMFT